MWKRILIIIFVLVVIFSLSGIFSASAQFLGPPGNPPFNNNLLQATATRAFVIATTTVISTRPQLIFRNVGNPGDIILFPNQGQGGKVGIGTLTPDEKLHVSGNLKVTGDSLVLGTLSVDNLVASGTLAGSLSAGYISAGIFGLSSTKGNYTFQGSSNSNPILFIDAINERVGVATSGPGYALDVAGTAHLRGTSTLGGIGLLVSSLGKVSIGTTTQSAPLNVWNSGSGITQNVDSAGAASYIQFHDSTSGYNGNNDGFTVGTNGGSGYIWNRESGYIYFGTNDTARMTIDSLGNVGIGVPSTLPYRLIVSGGKALFQDSLLKPALFIDDDVVTRVGVATSTPSYTFDVVGNGRFSQPVIVGTPTIDSHAATKNYVDSAFTGGTVSSTMALLQVTGTTTLGITAGNIGLGVSTPSAKLDIRDPSNQLLRAQRTSVFDSVQSYLTAASGNGAIGWNNWTTEAGSTKGTGQGDILGVTGDSFYMGKTEQFDSVYVDIGTAKSSGGTFAYEYSTGEGTWSTISGMDDDTSAFTNDGSMTFTPPGDWAPATVNGVADLYWLRVRVTGSSFSTEPTIYLAVPNNGAVRPMDVFANGNDTTPSLSVDPQGHVSIGYSTIDSTYRFKVLGAGYFSGALAAGSTLSGGAISGSGLISSYDSTRTFQGGLAETQRLYLYQHDSYAALATATVQYSPTIALAGEAWDGSASKKSGMKMTVIPSSKAVVDHRLAFKNYYVDNVADNSEVMSISSDGVLEVVGASAGSEVLANSTMTDSGNWTTAGDWAYTTDDYTYTHSSGSGTITQSSSDFVTAAKPNTWYRFSFTNGVAGSNFVVAWIGTEFAEENTYFTTSATEVNIYFKSNSNPGDFVIYTSSSGSSSGFRIDDVSLKEMQGGDIHANGSFGGGGVASLKIDKSGNIGIATTTPSYTLDVVGAAQFSQPIIVGTPTIASHATTKSYVDSVLTAGTATGTLANLTVTGTTTLATTGGNVGIGTTTPSAKLSLGNSAANQLLIYQGASLAASVGLGIESGGFNLFTDGGATKMFFKRGGNSGTVSMTIDNSGNVGIGTTTPNAVLDIHKAGATEHIRIYDDEGNNYARIGYEQAGNTSLGIYNTYTGVNSAIEFGFGTGTFGATNSKVVFKGSGNVGIATTTPDYALTLGSGQIAGPAGSISAPTYTNFNDPDTGIWFNGTGNIALSVNGAQMLGVTGSIFQLANGLPLSWGGTDVGITGTNNAGTSTDVMTFNVGGGETMRIARNANSFNVGIGTTTPSYALTLGSGQLALPGGSSSTPSFSFFNDSNSGIYSVSDGVLGLTSNGSELLRIGSVSGVPAWGLTSGSLSRDGTGSPTIQVANPGHSFTGDTDTGLGRPTANQVALVAGGSNILTVSSGTYNGVGIATTTPSYTLDVVGAAQFSQPIIVGTPTIASHATTKSYVDSVLTAGTATGTLANLTVTGTTTLATTGGNVGIGTTTLGTYKLKVIQPPVSGNYGLQVIAGNTATDIVAQFTGNSGILSQGMTILQGGNVGIGTTTPTSKLTVTGVVRSTTGGFVFPDASTQTTAFTGTVAASAVSAGTFGSGIGNYTFGSATLAPILAIDSTSEKVGVGTSTPVSKFSIAGSADTVQLVVTANGTQSNSNPLIQLRNKGNSVLSSWHSDNAQNLFLGYLNAPNNNISGTGSEGLDNIFIGYRTGNANATGTRNTAVGSEAFEYNTYGTYNSAFGTFASHYNVSGSNNSSFGQFSNYQNQSGSNNTAIGAEAGYSNTSGSGNLFLGYRAGYSETGSNKLYIANSSANPPLIFGDFSAVRVGIATNTPSYTLDVVGGAQFSQPIIVGTPTIASHATTKSYVDSVLTAGTATGTLANLTVTGTTTLATTGGRVGIGTANPTQKLQVTGGSIQLSNDYGVLNFDTSGGIVNAFHFNSQDNMIFGYRVSGSGSYPSRFYTGSSEMMRLSAAGGLSVGSSYVGTDPGLGSIIASGNVGIGTTTLNYKFTVDGSTYINGLFNTSGDVNIGNYAYAKRFYDLDDNNWYIDPASASIFSNASFGGAVVIGTTTPPSDAQVPLIVRGTSTFSGNVGIGTTTPIYRLSIANSAGALILGAIDSVSRQILIATGTASLPSVAFDGDTNTGIYRGASDQVAVTTGGSRRAAFDSAGITAGAGNTGNALMNYNAGTTTTPAFGFVGDTDTGFSRTAANFISFITGGSTKMVINSSGNVGIGDTTPSYALDVAGTGQFTQPVIVGTPTLDGHAATKSYIDPYAVFLKVAGTGTSTYAYSILQDNIGIGDYSLTAPTAKLEVDGGIRLNTAAAKPTCNSSQRGTFWLKQGTTLVKDTVEVCAKDDTDAYAWRTIY